MTDVTAFDRPMSLAASAHAYRALGLQVVPASAKAPAIGKWGEFMNELVPNAVFERWFPSRSFSSHREVGIICGAASGGLLVVDLDAKDGDFSFEWFADVCAGREIQTPNETTPSGGLHYYFKAPEGYVPPTFKTTVGVDVRGQGGFIVCAPSVRDGGRYTWRISPLDCPIMEAPDWLLRALEGLRSEYPDTGGGNAHTPSPPHDLDRWGYIVDGRETMARDWIWGLTVNWRREREERPTWEEYEEKLRESFGAFERKVRSRHPDGLEAEGRGWTMYRRKGRNAWAQWAGKVTEAASERPARPTEADEGTDDEPQAAPAQTPDAIAVRPLLGRARQDVPPRDWIVPGLLLRRYITLLVAPGAVGKSLLTLQVGMACAARRPWGGFAPHGAPRVLIINAEDDADEQDRRAFAAADAMRLSASDLGDRISFAEEMRDIIVARVDPKTHATVVTPLLARIKARLVADKVDVLVVDPFVETMEGNENDNSQIKSVAALWRQVARDCDCAVVLVHHTKKYAKEMAGDADAARGASSLINLARIGLTLFSMTADEAAAHGIDEMDRGKFIRLDDAKNNLTLPSSSARWFEKVGIEIGNGTGDRPSDMVGALVPWVPTGPLSDVPDDKINNCLRTIERGVEDPETGEPVKPFTPFGPTKRGGSERYVGKIISEFLAVDAARADLIVRLWLDSGLLVAEKAIINRKERDAVRVDFKKAPGWEAPR